MKQQEILLNTIPKPNGGLNGFSTEEIGENHLYTNLETPMKADAFELSDAEKKYRIAEYFAEIMDFWVLT